MQPSWREISRIFGFILLFGVLAFNLYQEASIWTSIYRSMIVFLIYSILVLFVTSVFAKILHQYEVKKLREVLKREEEEREKRKKEREAESEKRREELTS
ncbi:hypothetical protein K8I28_10925 [bacterium]|nr:hypothetical protein [bacterium]